MHLLRLGSVKLGICLLAVMALGFNAQVFSPHNAMASGPDLVTNGSFENVPDADNGPDPSLLGPGNITIPGWTQTTGCGSEVWSFGFIRTADTGNRLVELDANCNGQLEQAIATTPGGLYKLSYAFAARPESDASSNALDVSIDGAVVQSVSATSSDFNSWSHYSFSFVAGGSSTTLAFAGAGDEDSLGSLLDSVSVVRLDSADCKKGGWASIMDANGSALFKNQGDCVSFIATHGKNEPGQNIPTSQQ